MLLVRGEGQRLRKIALPAEYPIIYVSLGGALRIADFFVGGEIFLARVPERLNILRLFEKVSGQTVPAKGLRVGRVRRRLCAGGKWIRTIGPSRGIVADPSR